MKTHPQYGSTPLHDAAFDGHDETVSTLIEKYGADVNTRKTVSNANHAI